MNDFINYVIFFSGTFIGGILTYFIKTQIEHRLAIARNYDILKATEFNKASAVFRTTFVDIQFSLRTNGGKRLTEIVTSDILTSHEKAKIMFEPFVDSFNLPSFNIAWNNYKNSHKNYYRLEDVFIENGSRKDECEYCLKQIDLLLDFAKPKI